MWLEPEDRMICGAMQKVRFGCVGRTDPEQARGALKARLPNVRAQHLGCLFTADGDGTHRLAPGTYPEFRFGDSAQIASPVGLTVPRHQVTPTAEVKDLDRG